MAHSTEPIGLDPYFCGSQVCCIKCLAELKCYGQISYPNNSQDKSMLKEDTCPTYELYICSTCLLEYKIRII